MWTLYHGVQRFRISHSSGRSGQPWLSRVFTRPLKGTSKATEPQKHLAEVDLHDYFLFLKNHLSYRGQRMQTSNIRRNHSLYLHPCQSLLLCMWSCKQMSALHKRRRLLRSPKTLTRGAIKFVGHTELMIIVSVSNVQTEANCRTIHTHHYCLAIQNQEGRCEAPFT